MYAFKDGWKWGRQPSMEMSLDDIVDLLPADKLSWVIQQVERTVMANREKEKL